MRNRIGSFLMIFLLIAGIQIHTMGQGTPVITDHLSQQMENTAAGDLIRINITLAERIEFPGLLASVKTMNKKERRSHVIDVLKAFTTESQKNVMAELSALSQSKSVEKITTYWVANVISCQATPAAIEQLSVMADISSIDYDEYRQVIDPMENKYAYAVPGNAGSKEITWNITKINADEVWDLGLTGEGIIVSVIDTGVNYDHYDLEDHMWESDDYPNHGWDFYSNDNDPMDGYGHGTHCAGTVAGDGTAGSQTGVAPDALIMACKVTNAAASGTESMIWSAVEFSIEQGADVISLSMGWQHSWGPNRTIWRESFDAVLAAGMVASVAAGNEGSDQGSYPIPDNVRCPGDCPPPWLNPDQTLTGGVSSVICVGSTTIGDGVSNFSSRGPVTWELINPFNDYPHNPEMGLIRPDIAAPGSNIKSLAHYSNTGYESGWSGTSMATPANAGMIALMLQKNNQLTPEQISQIVEETAVELQSGKNNNSGSGRIDALAAVEATSFPGPSYYSHVLNDATGFNNGQINPGNSMLITLAIANYSDETVNDITVTIKTDSEFITLTDSTEYFGDFGMDDIIEVADAFAFEVADNIPAGEMIAFSVTSSNEEGEWESGFDEMAYAINLQLAGYTIDDSEGNNNGLLDPGETADFIVHISNSGQLTADDVAAQLASLSGMLIINSASIDLGDIAAGEDTDAAFNVTVDESAEPSSSVGLILAASSGSYNMLEPFYAIVGAIVEDFETGDFSKFPWEFDGDADWEISNIAMEGSWSAKSGAIDDNETSEIKITIDVANDDHITFLRKVSSESNYDFLRFYIDNTMVDQWSGILGWSEVSYPVTQGEHTFRWAYEKDGSTFSGTDEAWIDFIELPPIGNDAVGVYAGIDYAICEGADFTTGAYATNYNLLLWQTSGTGTFGDVNELTTTYMPSDEDYEGGTVSLTLTGYATGQEPASDEMTLTFDPLPEDAGTVAGAVEVCNGTTEAYQVETIASAEGYNWELTPEEAGTMSMEGNMVMIDWADDYIGEAILKVQGMNECGGGAFSDELVIMVDECSGVGEISEKGFKVSPNPNSGSFTVVLNNELRGAQIRMTDMTGNVVFEKEDASGGSFTIETSDIGNGIYFLMIKAENERMIEKVIIQK